MFPRFGNALKVSETEADDRNVAPTPNCQPEVKFGSYNYIFSALHETSFNFLSTEEGGKVGIFPHIRSQPYEDTAP
jgi:hypothetical protein